MDTKEKRFSFIIWKSITCEIFVVTSNTLYWYLSTIKVVEYAEKLELLLLEFIPHPYFTVESCNCRAVRGRNYISRENWPIPCGLSRRKMKRFTGVSLLNLPDKKPTYEKPWKIVGFPMKLLAARILFNNATARNIKVSMKIREYVVARLFRACAEQNFNYRHSLVK